MFKKYLNHILILSVVFNLMVCEPTLDLVYFPQSVRFGRPQPIKCSSIADLLSLTLGYSLAKSFEWQSFEAITDVFSLPKASITVRINGHNIVNADHKSPIVESQNTDKEFEIVSQRTEQRFKDNNRLVLKIDSPKEDLSANQINGNQLFSQLMTLSAEQRFAEGLQRTELKKFLSNENIDKKDPNIKELVLEIETINEILESLNKLKKSNENLWPIRAVIWFDIRSIGRIVNNDNYDPFVQKSAQLLISNLIEKITHEFRTLYDNKVMITAIEDDLLSPVLVRNIRQTQDSPKTNPILNLAHNYYHDFHTAFAMIAFTTLLIALAVFGISVSMWNIDPGKDSIIYRMTAQRIKKDQ